MVLLRYFYTQIFLHCLAEMVLVFICLLTYLHRAKTNIQVGRMSRFKPIIQIFLVCNFIGDLLAIPLLFV